MSGGDWLRDYETGARSSPKRVTLDVRKVGATITSSARHRVDEDVMRGQLVHRLEAYVLADHLVGDTYEQVFVETVTFAVPGSWWQHFKRDHLPTFAKWSPVKMAQVERVHQIPVTVRFDRWATYPEANIALEAQLGRPYVVEVATTEKRTW